MEFNILLILLFALMYCVNGMPIVTDSNLDSYFIKPRIIGGVDAPQGSAPYMAAILIGDAFVMVACGGSLLLPNLILTAAHCIDVYLVPGLGLMQTFHGNVGSNNFREGGTTVHFANYHMHPDWDAVNLKNDVGMLLLKKSVQLDKNIQLVSLNFNHVGGEVASFVTGWGLISTRPSIHPFYLQRMEVKTVDPQVCVDVIREASTIWWPNAPYVDPEIEICSLNSDGGALCYGDSGSPLMCKKTGTQIGIASWAFACMGLGVPDMHARVSAYKEFITYFMKLYQ